MPRTIGSAPAEPGRPARRWARLSVRLSAPLSVRPCARSLQGAGPSAGQPAAPEAKDPSQTGRAKDRARWTSPWYLRTAALPSSTASELQ